MFGRTVLCIYDNQPTDQPREKNNTNRSYYPRQRTTNRYSTANEENTNNDNQPDSESKNQQEQQQQEPNTTTTNETQQQNQAENREQKQQQQKNFTIRKAKTTSSTQYHINKEPPPKTTDNYYPEIQKTTPTKKENKRSTSPPQKQAQPELTTIPETQIVSGTQTQEATQISFLSPSMVTKNRYQIPSSTPETIDVTTPANNEPNNKETTSTPTAQHEQHQRTKTFTTRLYRMNFVDTGAFRNATLEEQENLTALAMYYTLGEYDPSNRFIKTYRNKGTINKYKIITEAKTTKTNTFSRIYQHLDAIKKRVEIRKQAKNKHKNTLKVILNNTT